MNSIDILILVVGTLAIIFGFWKGFISQLGSVVGIIVGILACRLLGQWLTAHIAGKDADATDLYIYGVVANLVLFLAGFIGTRLVAHLLKMVSKTLHLTPVDRILGSAFNLFEWMLVLSLMLNLWQAMRPDIDISSRSTLAGGKAGKWVINLAPQVFGSEKASRMWSLLDTGEKHSGENEER